MRQSIATTRRLSLWGQAALLAAVYFVAAKLSLALAIPPGYATPVWPPSGIALAALLMYGHRVWPGVWIGAALVNYTVNASWFAAALIGTGNTLEALTGAVLIRHAIGVPYRFERGEDVVKFVALAALSATVAATVAALPLEIGHALSGPEIASNWFTWWQGDASGIIIVTPLILSWSVRDMSVWTPRRIAEVGVFALLLLLASHAIYDNDSGLPAHFRYPFVLLPFIIWAGLRFGQREVTTASSALCAVTIWYTVLGHGPFVSDSLNESLLVLLAYIITVVVVGLLLSAMMSERARAVDELRKRRDELEIRVHERTAAYEQANRALQDDIAQRVRMEKLLLESEQQLMSARAAAERANQAKSEFLAKMSHELRTPLNSLLILAKLLADNAQGNLSAKQVQYAQTIHGAGMDLLSIINDILDLARIESGALTAVTIAPMRFADLRDHVERSFRQVANERGLEFSITLDRSLPAVMQTDAKRLHQILKNLLANAFKFTRQGSVSLAIARLESGWTPGHARLDAAGEAVAFSVTDTGIGIPEDKQKMIFDAFQQADGSTSREYGGTGLGLSISRELARLFGGEIRLTSRAGEGSSFTLYLPLVRESAS